MKLFAVCLGGRAPKGHTELHDVVFAAGERIEDCYEQLMDLWFGTVKGLHLDSWAEIDAVDGHRVRLAAQKDEGAARLYFVNLGAYQEGVFGEAHANMFLVAATAAEAKARAKKELMQGWGSPVHTDDLYEIDDCLAVEGANGLFVTLEKTGEVSAARPVNGYHLVPKDIVEAYMRRRGIPDVAHRKGFGD